MLMEFPQICSIQDIYRLLPARFTASLDNYSGSSGKWLDKMVFRNLFKDSAQHQ